MYHHHLLLVILISRTGQKITKDGAISYERFADHHVMFTDFTADHLVLCGEQQQQR